MRLPKVLRDQNTLHTDVTTEDDLRAAGIQDMDAVIAAAPRDTRNILVAQLAKHRFGIERVICHINDPGRGELYRKLGLEVVSPTRIIVDQIVQDVLS